MKKLGMKISSSLPVAFALLLGMSSTARADGPAEDAERSVIAVIDAARVEAGVPPLRRDANLDDAALIHAEDMAENGFVGHESQTTGDPIARVQSVGFPSARVGENVARAGSPAEAANRMFASQPHREQMVAGDYTDVGVAVVEGPDGFYVVQVFASRAAPEIPPPHAADVPRPVAPPQAPVMAPEASVDAFVEAAEVSEATLESAEAPVEAEAPLAAQMPTYESAETAQAAPFYPQAAAPSSQGAPPTVVLQVVPASNVQGYWVQHGGAWWFYAVPAGARPGTVLSAVPGGQGPGNVGTNRLPVSAQASVNGSPAQHYVAQPYGAQPYVAQPYVAQPYGVRTHYVAPRPSARVVVRSAVGNRRGIFGLGLMRSPRRHY